MQWIDALEKLWPVVVTITGQFAWIIRLESKVLYLEKDLAEHKTNAADRHDQLLKSMDLRFQELHKITMETFQTVSRLEGQMKAKQDR